MFLFSSDTYSHGPDLYQAHLHGQMTKSITTKGFPG